VSIIIASGGRRDVLKQNLSSLKSTSYLHYEVVVIDNSSANGVCDLVESFRREPSTFPIRYLDWRRKPFNYSEINNAAARQCSSPLLLFLNDDTSVIDPDWLASMVELAVRPEIGAVGAKLLYPDDKIQHAGIAVGVQGTAAHLFRGMDDDRRHYGNYPDVIRNVSAVTGACLMTRTDVFWELGGFDADKLPIDFNDVDLCLKINARGYRVLYTPFATLYHHESLSRRNGPLQPDLLHVSEIRSRWRPVVSRDPFYNSNLTRDDVDYSLRSLRLSESTERPGY
jgi:GT2 family glycosyltransferase